MSFNYHGTTGGYNNHDCRCPLCRAAWNIGCREHKRAKRAKGICVDCSAEAAPYARCDTHRLAHNKRMRERPSRRKVAA